MATARVKEKVLLARLPRTQHAFVNINMRPLRRRDGSTLFAAVPHGGTLHLFDADGRVAIKIPPPSGVPPEGSYAFGAALEPGFAWFFFHGGGINGMGKLALLDVDGARFADVFEQPLRGLTSRMAVNRDNVICVLNQLGEAALFDAAARASLKLVGRLTARSDGGGTVHVGPDGAFVAVVGGRPAFVRIDPRTGETREFVPAFINSWPGLLSWANHNTFLGFLPDGRFAVVDGSRIRTLSYPSFEEDADLASPFPAPPWACYSDGGGAIFAHAGAGGDVKVLGPGGAWRPHVHRFTPDLPDAPLAWSWTVIPDGMLALCCYGEVCRYDRDGRGRIIHRLDNRGEQALSSFAPSEKGPVVYAGPFINSSLLELNVETGAGRNIRGVPPVGGQVNWIYPHKEIVYMGCYAAGAVAAYDPAQPVQYPVNPRHVLTVGEEQMRPCNNSVRYDGRHLWFTTHAKYGSNGGALVRFDPKTETCRVWRNLVPGHNPAMLCLAPDNGTVFVGTGPDADGHIGPRASTPAAVFAFKTASEKLLWTVAPLGDEVAYYCPKFVTPAHGLFVMGFPPDGKDRALILDPVTGAVRREVDFTQFSSRPGFLTGLFMGPDSRIYAATRDGLYGYDPDAGLGDRILALPMREPRVRGRDLFFLRDDYTAGMAPGFFR